jgi:hypothetical protein
MNARGGGFALIPVGGFNPLTGIQWISTHDFTGPSSQS